MNEKLKALYKTQILTNSRDDTHFKELPKATHVLEAYNPMCGDKYSIYLVLEEEQIFESHAAWLFESFNFNQRNLPFVLDEIARTYDVSIDYSSVEKSNYSYTGYFENRSSLCTC